MVRTTTLLLLLASTLAFGQRHGKELSGDDIIRSGLLRGQATITPGWIIGRKATNLYLSGDINYRLHRHVSLVADGHYFLDGFGGNDNEAIEHNHNILFGAAYHFPHKRFDPFVSFQPGIGYVQVKQNVTLGDLPVAQLTSKAKFAPVISAAVGFHYYVWKHIHFMGMLRYVHAQHPTEWNSVIDANELRLSFGLGWNVNLRKARVAR